MQETDLLEEEDASMFLQTKAGGVALLAAIIAAAGYSIWDQGPGKVRRIAQRNGEVVSKMKLLDIAALTYAADHNDRFPDAANWEQELRPYLDPYVHDFTLPSVPGQQSHRIALYKNVAGRKLNDFADPSGMALFFESTAQGPNAADNLETLPPDGQSIAVAFAMGHVYIKEPEWKQAIQEPMFHRQVFGELASPKR